MTICTKCANHKNSTHVNEACPEVWYNHVCGAITREPMIDPVTGKHGYAIKNDLGQIHITDDPHPFCRDINTDGNCDKFVECGLLSFLRR